MCTQDSDAIVTLYFEQAQRYLTINEDGSIGSSVSLILLYPFYSAQIM